MVGVTHAEPLFTPPDLGLLFTLPGTGWFRAMVNVAGTLNLDWAMGILVPDLEGPKALAAFEALARQAPPGANGVVYLPYLSDSGIIAPTVDPGARAAFGGLAPRHARSDMARAVYEGVAWSLTELLGLTGFSGDAVHLVGGGARSGLWPQMLADVCGTPVILSQGQEFGARGAALLARVAVGDLCDMAEAAALAPPVRLRCDPDPARAVAAEEGRQRFLAFRNRSRGDHD
jgi:sugar (pentulose or hexulose) kinase